MMVKIKNQRELDWRIYIKELSDFPTFIHQWEKDLIREITSKCQRDKVRKVLEVGCSNGRWLRWFSKEYNCPVYGADNNPAGFKKRDINFTLADGLHLPYKNETFDIVFSLGLVEHFTIKEKNQILKEQVFVLKKGGFIICAIPNIDFWWMYLCIRYGNIRCRGGICIDGYKHFRTPREELKNYFRKLNLEILSDEFIGWLFDTYHSHSVSHLLFIKRFIDILKLANRKFTSYGYVIIGRKP
jgi:SAM-dependent methyltransferase